METKIKTLAVIIQTENDKCYQVALTNEMIDCLCNDLKDYFVGGNIKVLDKELPIKIDGVNKKSDV